jgi:hypothetical protein
MAGPGPGEARIVLDCAHSRFVARVPIGKGPVTAATLIEALPKLTATMTEQLERIQVREAKK